MWKNRDTVWNICSLSLLSSWDCRFHIFQIIYFPEYIFSIQLRQIWPGCDWESENSLWECGTFDNIWVKVFRSCQMWVSNYSVAAFALIKCIFAIFRFTYYFLTCYNMYICIYYIIYEIIFLNFQYFINLHCLLFLTRYYIIYEIIWMQFTRVMVVIF